VKKLFAVALCAGLLTAGSGSLAVAAAATGRVLYVAPIASATSGNSCARAGYRSVNTAIARAQPGDTVHVCAGTYTESVRVSKAIRLEGERGAVINATGEDIGVLVTASSAAVTSLTVRNATGQGIFVRQVKSVTIEQNLIEHNDLGVGTSIYLYCTTANFVPDCGEGLHLSGVSYSNVVGNTIRDNSGGILISDELGPTHHNSVQGNTVTNNTKNCGITIVGHKEGAVTAARKLRPKVAGVYKNMITQNTVDSNGTSGTGAGILLANPRAGMAVYHNTIRANTITNNGLAGVQLNANTTGQYLDGNIISNNTIGTNNLLHSTTAGNGSTVGISTFIATGASSVQVTVTGNKISANDYGIYSGAGTTLTQSGNTFTDVTTPVFTA
jgi:parallel beta-helix repeat protein